MKPSTFIVSNSIEAIRMFTTFYMYEDPRSKSFWKMHSACAAAKYISENWDDITLRSLRGSGRFGEHD